MLTIIGAGLVIHQLRRFITVGYTVQHSDAVMNILPRNQSMFLRPNAQIQFCNHDNDVELTCQTGQRLYSLCLLRK
jgi:hypothetical protein